MVYFGRVLTAMITPFREDGSVDYEMAASLAVHLANNGTDSLVICGTTGESPTLSWAEEFELFKTIQGAVGGTTKIVVGTGSNSTQEAIEATTKACEMGLDGTLQVVPYYNKPPQEGLYQHFRAIADACPDFPMLLYNVPGRTSCNIAPETVARLSTVDSIVGIKEASGNLDQASQIRSLTAQDFAIYSGDDSLTLPLLAVGAQGVVSVASHIVGNELQAMIDSYQKGAVSDAQRAHISLFPLFKALFMVANPIPIKIALELKGWAVGRTRSPLVADSEDVEVRIREVMEAVGCL